MGYSIKGLARNLPAILLFALFIYSPAVHSEQFIAKSGEIRGTVYGQLAGDPLANATVRLVEIDRRTVTDENGKFRFEDLSPGDYTVTVIAIGYRLLEEDNVAMVKAERNH